MNPNNQRYLDIIPTGESLSSYLKFHCEKTIITKRTTLIYPGHIPVIALFLQKGTIEIRHRKRLVHCVDWSNCILGLRELMAGRHFIYEAIADSGAEISFLGRSTLQEIFNAGFLKELKLTNIRNLSSNLHD